MGLEVVAEHVISHKVLSNNAICKYVVGDDSPWFRIKTNFTTDEKGTMLCLCLWSKNHPEVYLIESDKDGVRMPSEIIWRSKFFVWFLFVSCVLWPGELGRMQVLILATKEFNGHLSITFQLLKLEPLHIAF